MAECDLCGYPVGSDRCNANHFTLGLCAASGCESKTMPESTVCAKHAGRSLPRAKRSDFIRGYCCAVSVLLRENGRNTLTDSLLRQCGSPQDIIASADESDLMEFRKAGMLP